MKYLIVYHASATQEEYHFFDAYEDAQTFLRDIGLINDPTKYCDDKGLVPFFLNDWSTKS